MWKYYFLKVLLKTGSVNKHESSLATGMKFPAHKHWNCSSSSKGFSPFWGSRKCLSQNCCRLLAEMVKHRKVMRMKKLHVILASCLPCSEVLVLESGLGSRPKVLGSAVVIWNPLSC